MTTCQWVLLSLGSLLALWIVGAAGLAVIAHKVETERARRWPS